MQANILHRLAICAILLAFPLYINGAPLAKPNANNTPNAGEISKSALQANAVNGTQSTIETKANIGNSDNNNKQKEETVAATDVEPNPDKAVTHPETTTKSSTTVAPIKNSTTVAPITSSTTDAPIISSTTVAPVTSSTTVSPITSSTTVAPITTPAPIPIPSSSFSWSSFIGGIVLAFGMMAIGLVAFKFYKARNDRNYQTL